MRRRALWPIAETGDRFADFRPYVASIDDAGTVAFQAALAGGGEGIFTGGGDSIEEGARTSPGGFRRFTSHPDIDGAGRLCVYAERADGAQGLLAGGDFSSFEAIGPLGPTASEDGAVALRSGWGGGPARVYLTRGGRTELIAESGEVYAGFEGLPVITSEGAVVFRADLVGGGQVIVRRGREREEIVVRTGDRFTELGRFPDAAGADAVAFVATERSGGGVFVARGGAVDRVVGQGEAFEPLRGAFTTRRRDLVFYAAPPGGPLAIYAGPDPEADRVLGIGDAALGSRIATFILNPVSMNERGQLALRLELEDGRQAIARLDPE